MSDERKASLAVFLSIIVILVWTNLFMTPPALNKDATPEAVDVQPSKPVRGLNAPQAASTSAVVDTPVIKQPALTRGQAMVQNVQPGLSAAQYSWRTSTKLQAQKLPLQS